MHKIVIGILSITQEKEVINSGGLISCSDEDVMNIVNRIDRIKANEALTKKTIE